MSEDPTQGKRRSPFPPLGLMYVASALREAGFKASILDCTFLSNLEEVEQRIDAARPRAVGIYSMITMTKNALRLARAAKRSKMIVIFGGPDPSLDPHKYLDTGSVDYVVVGEGEETAPELLDCILNGGRARDVRGVAFPYNGTVVVTSPRPLIRDLDAIPLPSRDLIDNERYRSVWLKDHGYALSSIITSRGCPYGCNYCSNPVAPFGRTFKHRTAENVADELEKLVNGYGYDRIWMADDVFSLLKEPTMQLCDEILRRELRFEWSCLTRADRVDRELLRKMKASGCRTIFYGVESGSQRILDAMNRGMTVEQVRRAVAATKSAGIRVHTFLQLGYPGEDYHTIQKTITLLKELAPNEFSFTISYPLPGTELHNMAALLSQGAEWGTPSENRLLFETDISELALRFALFKTKYEFYASRRGRNGQRVFGVLERVFKFVSDPVLKQLAPHESERWSKCPVLNKYIERNRKLRSRRKLTRVASN